MKLLVTGGAGYIGSVVAHQLVDAGHHVEIIDDLSTAATFHRMSIHRAADILAPEAAWTDAGWVDSAAAYPVAERRSLT